MLVNSILHKHVDVFVLRTLLVAPRPSPAPGAASLPHSGEKHVACRFTRIPSILLSRLGYSCWKTPGIPFSNPSPSY